MKNSFVFFLSILPLFAMADGVGNNTQKLGRIKLDAQQCQNVVNVNLPKTLLQSCRDYCTKRSYAEWNFSSGGVSYTEQNPSRYVALNLFALDLFKVPGGSVLGAVAFNCISGRLESEVSSDLRLNEAKQLAQLGHKATGSENVTLGYDQKTGEIKVELINGIFYAAKSKSDNIDLNSILAGQIPSNKFTLKMKMILDKSVDSQPENFIDNGLKLPLAKNSKYTISSNLKDLDFNGEEGELHTSYDIGNGLVESITDTNGKMDWIKADVLISEMIKANNGLSGVTVNVYDSKVNMGGTVVKTSIVEQ